MTAVPGATPFPPWPASLAGLAPPGTACCRCGRPASLAAAGETFCDALDCYEAYVAAATAHTCCGGGTP